MNKRMVLLALVLSMTVTAGCRKKNTPPTEEITLPATETTAAVAQETEQETTAPTVNVLEVEPLPYGDGPSETTEPEETTPPATQPSATIPPVVDSTSESLGENDTPPRK